MTEETRQKIKAAAQRRSEEAARCRQARIQASYQNAKAARERRKNTDEYKLTVLEGVHKTVYAYPSEQEAIEKLQEMKAVYNPYTRVFCEIRHHLGYSRKLVKRFEIINNELVELDIKK